jgi:uncharacterized DUF497 family protein
MKILHFQWDKKKDIANYQKHGIHFSEAATVFYDDNSREYYDPDHSEKEDRYLMLGMSRNLHTLVVSYCFREPDDTIRIISSRKANKTEITDYFSGVNL